MTGAVCCACGRATDRTLDERGKMKVELRPYGPGGADICFQCAMATPETEAQTASAFAALLESNEAISPTGGTILTSEGPVPLPTHIAEEIARLLAEGKHSDGPGPISEDGAP
jgi:hypothetical protein